MIPSMFVLGLAARAAAPDTPLLVSPADGATDVDLAPALTIAAADGDADALTVRFYGRVYEAPGEDFSFVTITDTQRYTCDCRGGSSETFLAQTAWAAEQQDALDIAYVAHLGDCVQNGDEEEDEWLIADEAFSSFDEDRSPYVLPPGGLPYGLVVGNHEQTPDGDADGSTALYNEYFGIDRFRTRHWYGGYFGLEYDNHYDLFDAGGTSFLVLYLEYDESPDAAVLAWADLILSSYPDRHAIVVLHYLMDTDGAFSEQGRAVYDALSSHETLFLMLGGHVTGEVAREDNDGPRPVHSVLANYQGRDRGGDGWLRMLTFSPSLGEIATSTWSPTLAEWETDEDSVFTMRWDPNPAPWLEIGAAGVEGGEASVVWNGLREETTYQWKVEVSDGTSTVSAGPWLLTTSGATSPGGGADSGGGPGNKNDTDDTQGEIAEPVDSAETDAPPFETGGAFREGSQDLKVTASGCSCAAGPSAAGSSTLLLVTLISGLARRRPRGSSDAATPADTPPRRLRLH